MRRPTFGRSAVKPDVARSAAVALLCSAAIGLFACTGPSAGGPRTDTPAALVTPVAASPEREVPDILLHQGKVFLDGGSVLDQAPQGKLQKAESLFNAMLPRGIRWSGKGVRTYTLTMDAQADGAQMKSIVKTAAAAGWPVASMGTDDSVMALHSESYPLGNVFQPLPPGASPQLQWPDRALTIVVRSGTVELWRVSQVRPTTDGGVSAVKAVGSPDVGGKAASPPLPAAESAPTAKTASSTQTLDHGSAEAQAESQNLAALKAMNVATELPGLLEAECSRSNPCSPAILYVANDASAALIGQSLGALAKLLGKRDQSPLVQLRFDEPAPEGPPPNARADIKNAAGRLAPEAIQKAVRAQFGAFRLCYEQGLTRDPRLTGKVIVRFVIGRNGNVSAAGTDNWQSSMPDAEVTRCVVEQMKATVFLPPEGGIVTVVYPIMFSPGP